MKAAVLHELHQEVKITEKNIVKPEANQVLIKIKNAALNLRDVWIQKGLYPGIKLPVTLGSDGAGIVKETGSNVDKKWLGKEVVINPGLGWGENEKAPEKTYHVLGTPADGTFAEYITLDVKQICEKPTHLNFAEASALPLAGVTGYRALFVRGGLQPADKVLITGIGGGVAMLIMQMAIAAGNETWVTSGGDLKIENAMRMGAKGGANYKKENWNKELTSQSGDFDLIVDSACGDDFTKLIDITKPGGRISVFGGTNGKINNIIPAKIFWRQISIHGSSMGSPADFKNMIDFFSEKKTKPIIDSVYKLDHVNEAMNKMTSNDRSGKIVLEISQ